MYRQVYVTLVAALISYFNQQVTFYILISTGMFPLFMLISMLYFPFTVPDIGYGLLRDVWFCITFLFSITFAPARLPHIFVFFMSASYPIGIIASSHKETTETSCSTYLNIM